MKEIRIIYDNPLILTIFEIYSGLQIACGKLRYFPGSSMRLGSKKLGFKQVIL